MTDFEFLMEEAATAEASGDLERAERFKNAAQSYWYYQATCELQRLGIDRMAGMIRKPLTH